MQLVALGSNTTCSNPCAQTDTYVSGLHTLFTGMDARIGVEARHGRAETRTRRQPDRPADQPDPDDGDSHAAANTLPATDAARSTADA